MSINNCRIISLPTHIDPRGKLSRVEGTREVPFEIKMVYFSYHIPTQMERGGHAHHSLEQFIIAVSGSFEIIADDGFQKETFLLNDPGKGLYSGPYIWKTLKNFSDHAACLVICSDFHDEKEYIRDYETFLKIAREKKQSDQ